MRIVIVNYASAPGISDPGALLARRVAQAEFASGLARAGADVIVVQRFARDAVLRREGVVYDFVADGRRPRPWPWASCAAVRRRVADARPDVVHVNGLVFPVPTRRLRSVLGGEPTIVVQHHAERPRGGVRRAVQRWGLAAADGFLFTSRAQAEPWWRSGVLARDAPVVDVIEGSTGLVPVPRDLARARRPLPGSPSLLWVGRLHRRKDPTTLLDGFERLLRDVPSAHLTMVHGDAPLLGEVQSRLAASRRLREAVTLVGRVPHDELPWYFASADYFVAASLDEGSGFALSEAIACGAVPIVTDIPAFAAMTAGGRLGGLWRPGDPDDFVRVARAVMDRPRDVLSRAAVAHHGAYLSADAIGRRALAAYAEIAARRVRGRA